MFKFKTSKPIAFAFAVTMAACSGTPARKTVIFQAGDKATVDKLNYSVVDTQIFTRLGEDPNVRVPQNRFYVVQLSVFNAGTEDAAIPAMSLVDDSGKTYEELTDGNGVARWLGVIRHVSANQTETGTLVFDAPASHYKMKLTDDTDANDVYIDIPLSFAHEQMSQSSGVPEATDAPLIPAAPAPPADKKKK